MVWIGLPLQPLFECLEPENIALLLSAVLAERQIVFLSSQYSLLTACAEAITSLIYPLTWSHVYIPILPRQLIGMLAAPVPYLVGVHTSCLTEEAHCHWSSSYCVGDDTVQVFLDENRIAVPAGSDPLPAVPAKRRKKLLGVISQYAPAFAMRGSRWTELRLPLFDSAYSMVATPAAVEGGDTLASLGLLNDKTQMVNESAIRRGFLNFFEGILLHYRQFLVYDKRPARLSDSDADGHSAARKSLGFQQEQFMAEQPADQRAFMTALVNSQAFCQFISERLSLSQLAASILSSSIFTQNSASIASAGSKTKTNSKKAKTSQQDSINSVYGKLCVASSLYSNCGVGGCVDIVFFDESLDAKMNRYALQRFQNGAIETPFLDNAFVRHVKTYVPPTVDLSPVDVNGDSAVDASVYTYNTFPRLR